MAHGVSIPSPTPELDLAERLTVEIWSDIVCSWCCIGKRRFEAALREFEHADAETVVELLDDVGVPADEVREALSSDAHAEEVHADQARARQFGISGVPFFALDGRYGLPGAQPTDTVLQALRRTWQERAPLKTLGRSGVACDDDGCAA